MPRYATCSRSSNGSPRFANRRARCDASERWASISSLRSLRSCVALYSTNFAPQPFALFGREAHAVGAGTRRVQANRTLPSCALEVPLVDDRGEDLGGQVVDADFGLARRQSALRLRCAGRRRARRTARPSSPPSADSTTRLASSSTATRRSSISSTSKPSRLATPDAVRRTMRTYSSAAGTAAGSSLRSRSCPLGRPPACPPFAFRPGRAEITRRYPFAACEKRVEATGPAGTRSAGRDRSLATCKECIGMDTDEITSDRITESDGSTVVAVSQHLAQLASAPPRARRLAARHSSRIGSAFRTRPRRIRTVRHRGTRGWRSRRPGRDRGGLDGRSGRRDRGPLAARGRARRDTARASRATRRAARSQLSRRSSRCCRVRARDGCAARREAGCAVRRAFPGSEPGVVA